MPNCDDWATHTSGVEVNLRTGRVRRSPLPAPFHRCDNHDLYTHEPHVWSIGEGGIWYCPGSGVEADARERLDAYERRTG